MCKGIEIFSLKGKNALVTGACGHLGSAMAFALAESGANVYINSRSQTRSDSFVKRLRALGLSAEVAVFDVTSREAIEHFFIDYSGRPLHIVVNNAYVGNSGSIEQSASASYIDSYDVTLLAAHNLLQLALPSLRLGVKHSGDASIINMASMYAMVSPDQRIYESATGMNPPFYGAAKAALLQWSRYAACEFGKEGIRVNSISPGPFPSDSVMASDPKFIEQLVSKVPMGRVGLREEIKGPVLFLASSASSFVNGANIVVDGGWTCW
jgi:NAD(P)-dependent dehydrogenase (short-subunit alcohol dehydrogenase family)